MDEMFTINETVSENIMIVLQLFSATDIDPAILLPFVPLFSQRTQTAGREQPSLTLSLSLSL